MQGRFGGNQFDDDQNTLLLRRYFTLDATASHTLRHGVDLFVAVENLTNRRYDVGRTPVLTVGPPILARGRRAAAIRIADRSFVHSGRFCERISSYADTGATNPGAHAWLYATPSRRRFEPGLLDGATY